MDMWTELTKQSSNEALRRATVEAYHECNNSYGTFVRKSPGTRLAHVKDEVRDIVERVAATHGVDPGTVYQVVMRRLADTATTDPETVDIEKPLDSEDDDNPVDDEVLADARTDVNELEPVLVDDEGFAQAINHAEERVDLEKDTQKDSKVAADYKDRFNLQGDRGHHRGPSDPMRDIETGGDPLEALLQERGLDPETIAEIMALAESGYEGPVGMGSPEDDFPSGRGY